MGMKSGRALALAALVRWRSGSEFADKIVAETFARSSLGTADRAFALELFYGVLRNLTLLDFWIGELRAAPVDPGARDLLRLGLYQTLLIETAAHAAVYETVALARPRARPLVNAILRRALREKAALTSSGGGAAALRPFLRAGVSLREMVGAVRRSGSTRTRRLEQPAATDLRTDQPTPDDSRGISRTTSRQLSSSRKL